MDPGPLAEKDVPQDQRISFLQILREITASRIEERRRNRLMISIDGIEDFLQIGAVVPSNDRHSCPSNRPAHRIIAAFIELLGGDFDLPVLGSTLKSVAGSAANLTMQGAARGSCGAA